MKSESRPGIPGHISIVPHGSNVVEFRNGTWHSTSVFLTDESGSGDLYHVCAALDGSRTVSEIAKMTHISSDTVSGVVDTLVGLNLAEMDGQGMLRLGTIALLGADSSHLTPAYKEVLVAGDEEIASLIINVLSPSLDQIGVNVSRVAEDTIAGCRAAGATYDAEERERIIANIDCLRKKFVVYCGSHIDPITCKGLNLSFIRTKTPWMHAAVDGPFILVGPVFVPGDTSCYECFEMRVAMNLRDSKGYVDYKQALATGRVSRQSPAQGLKLLDHLLASHVAVEVFNFSVSARSTLIDKMLAIHLPSMEFSYHEVLRMPYCSACGAQADRDGSELYFSMKEVFDPMAGT